MAKKIIDVKKAGKVAPPASSRPIIVSNRPVLADPMVVADGETGDKPTGSAAVTIPVTRTARTIKPVSEALSGTAEPSEPAAPAEPTAEETSAPADDSQNPPEKTNAHVNTPSTPETAEATASHEAPVEAPAEADEPAEDEIKRDAEAGSVAAQVEADAAQRARADELEQLIVSGKYAVPINSVARKRSRMHIILFCLLALVLAILLADVLFDTGIVQAPKSIPYTHFFSA